MIIGVSISLAAQQIIPSIIITLLFLVWQFTSKQSNSYINKDLMNISLDFNTNTDLEFVFSELKKIKHVNGFEKIVTDSNSANLTLSVSSMLDTDFLNIKTKLEQKEGLKNVNISFISSLTF